MIFLLLEDAVLQFALLQRHHNEELHKSYILVMFTKVSFFSDYGVSSFMTSREASCFLTVPDLSFSRL